MAIIIMVKVVITIIRARTIMIITIVRTIPTVKIQI